MYENLKAKVESVSANYADLLSERICAALREGLTDGTVVNETGDGIKCLHHAITILERIDRLNRRNGSGGQDGGTG
jgi:hypothetical protein